jgi:ATP-binding cassette subfamily B (MDR/TAP) protein 1
LDSESELVVQEALDNVLATQKRTTVIIAHRLSTIRNADIIAVVMGGEIVETGTHDELMVTETGYYRNLVEKQKEVAAKRSSSFSSRASIISGAASSEFLVDLNNEGEETKLGVQSAMLEFKDITFTYPTRPDKQVLKKFNLKIAKGETVALVGPSGGGKSTTVALIERFYDPVEGSMEYCGVDIKSLNVKWYRDQIGFVGQEPTLFNETIANNIAYGAPDASRNEIEEAARQANAFDFISSFPEGFDTPVGERGAQLSGGQKQRIAIARALVKKPEVLLLDEATSALDNESEAVVQAALDKLMESKQHTCVVIAHRLTTIQNADRIAFISGGHVKEFGTHDELMEKPKGRYKRLVEAGERGATVTTLHTDEREKEKKKKGEEKEDEEEVLPDWEKQLEEKELGAFSLARARQMAAPDAGYLIAGSIGAIMAGSVFPMWGLLFAETIDLLFRRVYDCDTALLDELGFETCEDYWAEAAEEMRQRSFEVAGFWAIVAFSSVAGNMLTFWGFGNASERMNKRVRDAAFESLVRQEVSYFDQRSVGKITSQLQDDASRLQTFTGEPIRSFLIACASVLTGLVLSFVVSIMLPA